MAYTFAMDPTDDNYVFPNFSNMVFKSGEAKIDSRVSRIFRKFY